MYADTVKNMHQLAGIPDSDEFVRVMSRRTVPLGLRLRNAAYVMAHKKELGAILADSAGLEFFTGGQRSERRR